MKKKVKKAKPSGLRHAASSRNTGGPMKHRLEPKKGAKNDQAEYLDYLADDQTECTNCKGVGYTFDRYQSYKLACNCEAGLRFSSTPATFDPNNSGPDIDNEDDDFDPH
jgi:hypothetical protein